MDAKAAELLAVEALTFLAENSERLERFLALSGIQPVEIRSQASEPGFLGAILDHVLADERLLLDFAAAAQRDPAAVSEARRELCGPAWERDMA